MLKVYQENGQEFVRIPTTNSWGMPLKGARKLGVHSRGDCAGKFCPIHRPSDWVANADNWPYLWRADIGVLERICPCGAGHPDRDAYEFLATTGRLDLMIHGECGAACCTEPRRRTFRRFKENPDEPQPEPARRARRG